MKPNEAHRYDTMSTPVGEITLVVNGESLVALLFESDRLAAVSLPVGASLSKTDPILKEARRQLKEYFAGKRREFDLPLAPPGTPFQLRVWSALRKIPYGVTWSYQEQALSLGHGGVRAVGSANGRNPLPIVVPCHRVIGKNRSLTGFGGGLEAKRTLLELEGHRITGTGPKALRQ